MQRHPLHLPKLVLAALSFILHAAALSADESSASFVPTWKLLNNEAKQQFIGGYLQGWKDAERVTAIALDYVKENPQKAVEGLEKIRALYDMQGLAPDELIRVLDAYFSQVEHKDATLSPAINASKQVLR